MRGMAVNGTRKRSAVLYAKVQHFSLEADIAALELKFFPARGVVLALEEDVLDCNRSGRRWWGWLIDVLDELREVGVVNGEGTLEGLNTFWPLEEGKPHQGLGLGIVCEFELADWHD